MKIAALALLGRLGDATAQARLEATVDQVEKLGLKEMVRDVQLAALENRGERAVAMDDEEYGKLVERLKGFLNDGPIDAASAKLAVNVALAAEQSESARVGGQGLPGVGTGPRREQGREDCRHRRSDARRGAAVGPGRQAVCPGRRDGGRQAAWTGRNTGARSCSSTSLPPGAVPAARRYRTS